MAEGPGGHDSNGAYYTTVTAKGSCSVFVSLDAGITWTQVASWSSDSPGPQALDIPFANVPQSQIRVRIDCTAQRLNYQYFNTDGQVRSGSITGTASAAIADVAIVSTESSTGYLLTRIASVKTGQTFQVALGDTYGGHQVQVGVDGANHFTLSAGGAYEPNLGTPTDLGMVPTSDLSGRRRWVAMGGASAVASVASGTLAPGASANVSLTLAKTSLIKKITTDYPAWIRIFATDAARTVDAGRSFYAYPRSGTGVVADTVTAAGALSVLQDPKSSFSNDDSPVTATAYVTITNFDTVSRDITLTIVHLPQEV